MAGEDKDMDDALNQTTGIASSSTMEGIKQVHNKVQAVLDLQNKVAEQLQDCCDASSKHQDLDRLYGDAVEQLRSKAQGILQKARAIDSRVTRLQTRATRLRLLMQNRALEEEHRREAEVEKDKQLLPEVVAAKGVKPQPLKSSTAKRVSSSKTKKAKPRVVELEE